MRRVTHIAMHNVCQFADIEADIAVGLNAVCGRNGSGKTSLLRGLVYGLTGKVDGDYGTQTDLQRDDSADPGYVEVTLSGDDGREHRIRRYTAVSGKGFRDSVHERRDGGEWTLAAVSRKPVTDYMNFLLQVEDSLLFQICWGRQSRLDRLLTSTANEVSDFLAGLYGLGRCELLRQKIKLQLDTVADLPRSCVARRDKAAAELAALQPAEELSAMLKGALDTRDAISSEMDSLKASLAKAADPAVKAARESSIASELARLASVPDPGEEPEAVPQTLQELRIRETDLRKRMSGSDVWIYATGGEKAANDTALQRLEESLAKLRSDLASAKARLSVPDDCCRLCRGTIVDKAAYERDRCLLITGFQSLQAYEEAAGVKASELESSIASRRETASRFAAGIAERQSERQAMDAELAEILQATQLRMAHDRWRAARDARDTADARTVELSRQLEEVRSLPVCGDGTQAALEDAKARHANACALVDSLMSAVAGRDAKESFLRRELEAAEADVRQYTVNAAARESLVRLRDIYSAKRVQARFLKAKIEDLNMRIARYLSGTGMPFSLYLDSETHTFRYLSQGGFMHPAAHLSGAQRNIASVVLQMAVFESISPEINLFLVDEPSESLDTENKLMLADLFRRMSTMLPAIQGTMLIVTRDEPIIDCCEAVITVSKEQ